MWNGTRRREDSEDEGDASYREGPGQQRARVSSGPSELSHYDIYALPSFVPPLPVLHSPTSHFQSVSLFVVNRSAGLSGLGIRIGLAPSPDPPHALHPITDPGFCLAREQGAYDPNKAILLGWVEEERLYDLERFVKSCEVPVVTEPPRGGEMLEWILNVGRKLEWEGILANADILLSDVLERR